MNVVSKITLYVFVAFLVANILDLASTYRFLALGYMESNPLLSHFNTIGIRPIDVFVKLAVSCGVLVMHLSVYSSRKNGVISDREYVTYNAISIFVWMFMTAITFLIVLTNLSVGW